MIKARVIGMAAMAAVLSDPANAQSSAAVSLKDAAVRIDQHVAAFYRSKKLPVPEVANDSVFLRRAFLVGVGRIPTWEEAVAFLETDGADKREVLADYLVASPGYTSHLSNWAFDLLRITDGRIGSTGHNEPYRHWVRQAMESNVPWDAFVRSLLASSGDGWDPETAAVGYYTRDRGMPLDNLANTMRIFLGSRMECAQCHDDPFGTTERRDFYELAAFTHGQGMVAEDRLGPMWQEAAKDARTPEYPIAQLLWDRVAGMSLGGVGDGRITVPSDYQYRDARPGELLGARTPFGKTVRLSEKREAGNGRELFADWVVTQTGQRFAEVIANRMWKRVMGHGVYEPVDEYRPAAETHSPELVTYLGQLMVDLKYDLRAFQNILMRTRTFQFATNPGGSRVESGDDFHGRKIARLSAEQIWDSLITLVAGNPDRLQKRQLDDRIYVAGKPVLVGRKTMPELSREVLALDSAEAVRRYMMKLMSEIETEGESPQPAMMMSASPAKMNADALTRASELSSPAPRDHLLYVFGASDREVVDAASREPNVGQVLSLMNGFVQRELVNAPKTHLYQALATAESPEAKIRLLYLAILCRPPSQEEMAWMLGEVRSGEQGVRNVVSALVMSSEFLFLQ